MTYSGPTFGRIELQAKKLTACVEPSSVAITWADIVAVYEKIREDAQSSRVSLLQCGWAVPDRLLQTISNGVTYPADPGSIDKFAGIPIVVKVDLLPDQWQLVDQFGEVLYAGSLPSDH